MTGLPSFRLDGKIAVVNLRGPLRLTALAANAMSPGGSIINISSKASTSPTPSTVVYAAAKDGGRA
jgi:short-subunit dehydrogenase